MLVQSSLEIPCACAEEDEGEDKDEDGGDGNDVEDEEDEEAPGEEGGWADDAEEARYGFLDKSDADNGCVMSEAREASEDRVLDDPGSTSGSEPIEESKV